MHLLDNLLVFVLAVVQPVAGYISFNRLLRSIESGKTFDRSKLYLQTIAGQWLLFAFAISLWIFQQRSWSELGYDLTGGPWFIAGVFLTVVAIVWLVMQIRQVPATPVDELRGLRQQLGRLAPIFPRNGNELGRFYALAVTAGIVEETLWRGFMIWYFSLFLPLWLAALISAIGFGLAHAYQGIENLPKVTIVGFAFTGLYLLTGSLLLPMVLHAAVDVLQGRLAYTAMRRCDNEGAPDTSGSGFANAS